ncbi:Mu transposase C-terminal domain-containing protein [Vibrio sp. dhg]|uniref:Mu transposase C-terminal domain-containing protein n=1 Tax=Vibrio sp. dhg TaxID=2163016 RepID=UPI000E4F721A|nr:Mu transposase C-terminal domain-containing protein [Vibrio sp. dhg]AXT73706.1 transposase [Vibrio sp. dhg]
MSGVEHENSIDEDFLGYFDEFIEENLKISDSGYDEIFNKIDNSFESTFDNLPKRIQQETLERLNLIKFIEQRLRGGWTEKNLNPLLNKYKAETGKHVPSWRVLADWKSKYYKSDKTLLALAPQHAKKGNRSRNSDSEKLIREAIQVKYLTNKRESVADAYNYYKSRVIEENRNIIEGKIKRISQRTFYNRINELPPYDVTVARYGKRYADREFRLVGQVEPARYPMEYVEIDHTPTPVILVDDKLYLPLGRPYLTILYDRFSGCIVGLYVSFRDPSYDSVRTAFLNAVLQKTWINERYPSVKSEWPCFGKITYLVVDNAAEFWSDSLEQALKPLVSDIHYAKAGRPWEKPHVEKAFDTFYKLLFSQMPGKTFSNITQLKDYNPKKDAVVRVSVFLELLYKWVIDYFNHNPDSQLRRIPYRRWCESSYRPNFYDGIEAEQLKIELGIINYRTLGKDGIRLHRLRYQSEALVEYKKRSAKAYKVGARLKIKTDPDDISHIYVYLDEDKVYLKVPVVGESEHLRGVSLYQHQRVCAVNRLNTKLNKNEELLAETYLFIHRKIVEEGERMANQKPSNSSLPKTTNLKKLAQYQNVGKEGYGSLLTDSGTNTAEPSTKEDKDHYHGIDLSDIDGY